MFLMRTTQLKRDTHVAPLGLSAVGIRHYYKHIAPLVLKKIIRKVPKRFFLRITHYVLFIVFYMDLRYT